MSSTILPAVRTVAVFGAFALAAILTGCGPTSAEIAAMDPQKMREVRAIPLCYSYASELKKGRRSIAIQQEMARRKLDCTEEVEETISDCSALRILSSQRHPTYQNVQLHVVRNDGPRTKRFRISAGGISSAELRIVPRTTHEYGIVTERAVEMLAAFSSRANQSASIYDCFSDFPVTEETARRAKL